MAAMRAFETLPGAKNRTPDSRMRDKGITFFSNIQSFYIKNSIFSFFVILLPDQGCCPVFLLRERVRDRIFVQIADVHEQKRDFGNVCIRFFCPVFVLLFALFIFLMYLCVLFRCVRAPCTR